MIVHKLENYPGYPGFPECDLAVATRHFWRSAQTARHGAGRQALDAFEYLEELAECDFGSLRSRARQALDAAWVTVANERN